jgi:type IV pilus assembly protein PilW
MRAPVNPSAKGQAGMSLVELLIGITLGLFITGAGITAFVVHLRESRALIAQSRLMQDLRAATDLITRDLRRAGYWGDAAAGVWPRDSETGAGGAASNPYSAMAVSRLAGPAVTFRFSRDAIENGSVDDNEQFGYRLRGGTLELQLSAGRWQAMTDPNAMKITRLEIVPTEQVVDLGDSCRVPCPVPSATCPPRLHVRSVTVTVAARSTTDAASERFVRSSVRLRNDEVTGSCPA